ncbi:propanediol dehydratase large subunit [Klebsiella pneumoniae]|uniref:Propanediol dehydratase large subunit n=1 Tax=Klebsiella pneumoniae TaxID=573 RepID=A0A377W0I6_KLEPN|nr:propanediol dehydratase large subunit [Klebsiella pneumoniae]STV71455.1 propanediol dehydratase large subunit [Klebsiella pneumoniae]
MRSKRFEALAKRPVNQDGFVKEWIEEGFIAMESPNDPKPSIRIVNGAVTELDGKPVEQFDLIDHFIARYGINLARAEEVMAMDSVKLANMLCDPNVKRSDIVPLTTAMTPGENRGSGVAYERGRDDDGDAKNARPPHAVPAGACH